MKIIIKPKPDKNKMTLVQLFDYIDQLEAENARLEESFQRATGEIVADPLPGATVDREQFNRAANEIGDSDEWTDCDKMALATFVNSLEQRLFGGADDEKV